MTTSQQAQQLNSYKEPQALVFTSFSVAFQLYRNVIKNATISNFCFVKNQINTVFVNKM